MRLVLVALFEDRRLTRLTPPTTAQILSPWAVTSCSLYPLPSKFVYVATAATHSESYPSRDVL